MIRYVHSKKVVDSSLKLLLVTLKKRRWLVEMSLIVVLSLLSRGAFYFILEVVVVLEEAAKGPADFVSINFLEKLTKEMKMSLSYECETIQLTLILV